MDKLHLYFKEKMKLLYNINKSKKVSINYIKRFSIILISVIVLITSTFIINVNYSKAATIEPEANQKVEYRAVELKDTDNGKQLIVEIWIHNLNFKGMDLRLEYDENIVQPSNISTNEIIDVNEALTIPECFEFANGFGGYLDYFAMETKNNEYRSILSMVGADDRTGTNEYLVEDGNIGDYVSITGEVMLARLSFNAGDSTIEDFTTNSLHLKEASTSPQTGIKVNVNGEDSYEAKSLYEFTLQLEPPVGTITGSVQLGEGLRENIQASYGRYVEYIANVTLYEAGQFNWDGIVTKESSLDELDTLEIKAQTQTNKDDGSFEIEIPPGEYDLIIEREGFLAYIIREIQIEAGDTIDIGNKVLSEGDIDRTGIIDLDDMVGVMNVNDSVEGDGTYQEKYDFGQKGFVSLDDLVSTMNNMDKLINIEDYIEGGG